MSTSNQKKKTRKKSSRVIPLPSFNSFFTLSTSFSTVGHSLTLTISENSPFCGTVFTIFRSTGLLSVYSKIWGAPGQQSSFTLSGTSSLSVYLSVISSNYKIEIITTLLTPQWRATIDVYSLLRYSSNNSD